MTYYSSKELAVSTLYEAAPGDLLIRRLGIEQSSPSLVCQSPLGKRRFLLKPPKQNGFRVLATDQNHYLTARSWELIIDESSMLDADNAEFPIGVAVLIGSQAGFYIYDGQSDFYISTTGTVLPVHGLGTFARFSRWRIESSTGIADPVTIYEHDAFPEDPTN